MSGAGTGSNGHGRQEQAAGAAAKLHQAAFWRALLGLAAVSTAIALAVTELPPCLDSNNAYYFVALTGLFFAGMTQVVASVWVAGGRDHVARSKLANVMSYASLAVAAGLTAASLFI